MKKQSLNSIGKTTSSETKMSIFDPQQNRIIGVGDQYILGQTMWPEAVNYNYLDGAHQLIMSYKHPTKKEVDAVQNAQLDLRLYVEKDVILLLYRFGDIIRWSDAPYNWYMNPAHLRRMQQDLSETQELLFHLILVDSFTGILKAYRSIGYGNKLSKSLTEAINNQIQMPFNLQF